MTETGASKIFFTGTHRVRAPEDTYRAVVPLLRDYGITRLADVTGLDTLGIPVVMSVRPLATTLSVSQGKGVSKLLASVSAAMEAIELWHAENAVPQSVLSGAPAESLGIPYDVGELEWPDGNLITARTRLDWIEAHLLPHGGPVLVPRAAVFLGRTADSWQIPGLTTSSNGLASGNTVAEATVHALYEVMERDTVAARRGVPARERRYIDPDTVDDDHCADLIARIGRAGGFLELEDMPGRSGVPCTAARLWREDLASTVTLGAGAHGDPAVALSRAITEAAQSRLTQIVGTRDDIPSGAYRPDHFSRPLPADSCLDWAEVRSAYPDSRRGPRPDHAASSDTDVAEAARLSERIRDITSYAPMRVILEDRAEFAVVKVICPGMRLSE
ncbi:YcaO-like family protein [Streptomyces lycii]|uniref:YcaO-like family protein n=1 Tax=Streptomyces lycii TaxID=2654337 RepID=A0ABQ7FI32_9ACTN|nr:YcaO-like family protein [Streptomyces lycii]KAF4406912.1 YcaO-like family protein [Streptomyces lycii]